MTPDVTAIVTAGFHKIYLEIAEIGAVFIAIIFVIEWLKKRKK